MIRVEKKSTTQNGWESVLPVLSFSAALDRKHFFSGESAHREAKNGKTVPLAISALLPKGYISTGSLSEESLLSVATDGSGLDEPQKRIVAQNANLLLLDGLDECGGYRNAIAEALVKWSTAHPDTASDRNKSHCWSQRGYSADLAAFLAPNAGLPFQLIRVP